MNNDTKELLKNSKKTIIDMQEKRENKEIIEESKQQDFESVANFVENARRNEYDYTTKIVGMLLDQIFEDANKKSFPMVPVNSFFSETYQTTVIPKAVVLPIKETDSVAPLVDTFYKKQGIMDFCEKNNFDTDYIYLLGFGGMLYSVPLKFNKKLFKDLGFNIYIDGTDLCIKGNKEACNNLINAVNGQKIKYLELPLVKCADCKELERKESIINEFISASKKNSEIVALNVCKCIISRYQEGSPVINRDELFTILKTTESYKRNSYPAKSYYTQKIKIYCETCGCDSSNIYLIEEGEGYDITCRPVFENDLRNALAEICSDFIYNKNNDITVITDTKKFEELVLNSKGKSRK